VSMDLEEFEELRREVEEAKTQADRGTGALEQLKARLKETFRCASLEQAKALRARLKKKLRRAERDYQKELKRFKAEYQERMDGETHETEE
jgi:hypothetical protein